MIIDLSPTPTNYDPPAMAGTVVRYRSMSGPSATPDVTSTVAPPSGGTGGRPGWVVPVAAGGAVMLAGGAFLYLRKKKGK